MFDCFQPRTMAEIGVDLLPGSLSTAASKQHSDLRLRGQEQRRTARCIAAL
jgi:hypothetical protein